MKEKKVLLEYNLQFFAKEGPGGEKTEEPTAKKLKEAREEGQVAKSQEVSNAFGLFSLFCILKLGMGYIGNSFLELYHVFFNKIADVRSYGNGGLSMSVMHGFVSECLIIILKVCAPFLALGFVVMFIVNVAQVGLKVSTKPMMPKLSKINPLSGFKRIFSSKSLFELVKSLFKIGIVVYIAYSRIKDKFGTIYLLYDLSLTEAVATVGDIAIDVGFTISLVYFVVGLMDFAFQKHKFKEEVKMTKQEVKDEYKNTEGNPEIKSQQRQRMREASQRRMMEDVKDADVVITNPTHLAVALKYDADNSSAPVVVAKGADFIANKIKEEAKAHNVMIVENKPLARMLYANVEIGEMIPQELYQAVAEVLAYVYSVKHKR
ncbi:flagellar biosynthetic protein FlhB [Acetitomaculum ruminis DSM 5522]|uniref:Flagellar biosynthetic protein FlhB n=1 Tax=Acetitomaculum ruminis DSM 5522 TaxID=1120918 RepID=A0A1I0ZIQ7_9FIRM|nr:flagellar biosynthesis protein FlhB [Acetitomaculum ruminis]SFB25242.1 flagellar biosynthetic protein FlhB [Acetitomaculum ruminis DSM 5522]